MRWIILLMLLPGAYALEWSEVHFNPIGNDNGREFIELIGAESLDGCTITDSASSDRLALQQQGSDIIMIVESDNLLELPSGITIYTIGAAIGNGLGNTGDSLAIACNSTLNMSYDLSSLDGFIEGRSLQYKDGWSIGNATPGIVELSIDKEIPSVNQTSETNQTCDNSLAIALGNEGYAGDTMTMRIISPGYAWFEMSADGLPYASGDTLTTRVHTIALPDAHELKVIAYANECDAKQRTIRYVRITKKEFENVSVAVMAQPESIPEPMPTEPVAQPEPIGTGQVIVDQDRSAVPWIAGFGIITVLASATVFLQLLRRGEA